MISRECVSNFKTLQSAFDNKDVAVVLCKDSKGKEVQTLCIVQEHEGEIYYMPFAFMLTPAFYPLIKRLKPPPLYGQWETPWDDD
jgi:hypothetical protein